MEIFDEGKRALMGGSTKSKYFWVTSGKIPECLVTS